MKILHHPYSLCSRHSINSYNKYAAREGILLRVAFPDGCVGYADCHPWIELDDLPWEDQLRSLVNDNLTPLLQRSLMFARQDAEARAQGVSLFKNLKLPSSHYLFSNLHENGTEELDDGIKKGFKKFKLKVSGELGEVPILQKLVGGLPSEHIKLRLDFNSKLTEDDFRRFLDASHSISHFIEFYEDPFPYDYKSWMSLRADYGIALACDKSVQKALDHQDSVDYFVFKPAAQVVNPPKHGFTVITSYLDHPIGQLAAMYTAAKAAQEFPQQVVAGGLASHFAYEPNLFSQHLVMQGDVLLPPEGNGFGFDDLLTQLNWLPCN